MTAHPSFDESISLLEAAEALIERALGAGRTLTGGGKLIDDHQVVTERLAYAATEATAARELSNSVLELRAEDRSHAALELVCVGAMGHLVSGLRTRLFGVIDELGLGDETMHHAETQAAAFAYILGGKEWLEGAVQDVRCHSRTRVADRDLHIVAGGYLGLLLCIGLVQRDVGGMDHQRTTTDHGIPRVDRQIDQGIFELVRVDHRRPEVRRAFDLQADGFAQDPAQ